MNDASYSCIASLLAGSLVAAAESGSESARGNEGAKNASR
jgi:hypothetical protein